MSQEAIVETTQRVSFICHSFGSIIARAALSSDMLQPLLARVTRLEPPPALPIQHLIPCGSPPGSPPSPPTPAPLCRGWPTLCVCFRRQPKLHTYLSFSGPHLGMLYFSNPLVELGIWGFRKWKNAKCLTELALKDARTANASYLYALSKVRRKNQPRHTRGTPATPASHAHIRCRALRRPPPSCQADALRHFQHVLLVSSAEDRPAA